MNVLIIILIVIAAIIALLLIIALFIKNEYIVEREVVINQPLNSVFDYIKHVKNQKYFSKWVMMDPLLRTKEYGTDATVGFVQAWDSDMKEAGKGEQEIKSIIDGEQVNCEVRFEKPFKGVADTFFVTNAVDKSSTKVAWGMKGKNKYPLNIMCLFMPDMLGKDMVISLNNLKGILEKG